MAKVKHSHFGLVAGVAVGLLLPVVLFVNHSQAGVTLLFAIPFLVQIRGIWILNKRFAKNTDKGFCWFYLITMAVCLLSYCTLWSIYASWETQNHWLGPVTKDWAKAPSAWFQFLSIVALFIIAVLLLLVIRMTRAIIEGRVLGDGKQNIRNERKDGSRWELPSSPRWWNLSHLRTGASEEPFFTLGFFFTVFLGISYLFGLALAFHDKIRPPSNPALYMRNLSPPAASTNQPSASPTPIPADLPKEYTFRFVEGLASLPLPDVPEPNYSAVARKEDHPKLKRAWQDASESNDSPKLAKGDLREPERFVEKLRKRQDPVSSFIHDRLTGETRKLLIQYTTGSPVSESLHESMVKDINSLIAGASLFEKERFKEISLSPAASILAEQNLTGEPLARLNRLLLAEVYRDEIAKNKFAELIQTIDDTARHLDRIRVTVVGYSDASQVAGTAYRSNYELAEARSQNTKQEILRRLGERQSATMWDNVQWYCISLSNEPHGSEKIVNVKVESAFQDSASLLLKSEHPIPLTLMDYIYFANYTITTTGYGDIVPNTAYTKFICSFANIVEVFFLVVFFNVLVSLRPKPERNSPLKNGELAELASRLSKLEGAQRDNKT
jgi:flagellar motor protein MotB